MVGDGWDTFSVPLSGWKSLLSGVIDLAVEQSQLFSKLHKNKNKKQNSTTNYEYKKEQKFYDLASELVRIGLVVYREYQ